MKNKITVIGGSGFIGTNLCQALREKKIDFEIIDLKISKQFSKFCKIGDVRNIDSLNRQISGDIVINLAAIHRDDVTRKADYFDTNVTGAKNVVLACLNKKIKKIIFTSSVAVYGLPDKVIGEDGKINPFNEYGRTKFEAEEIFRKWQLQSNHSLIIVRPTVVFGEGNRGNVFNLFNQIASGKFIMIGSGKNKKSIAYIGNIVSFLEYCIFSKEKNGLYNYVDTPDMTMSALVNLVHCKLHKKSTKILRIPYFFGLMIGYFFDVISLITRKKFSISSIRIRKFVSSTEFLSSKENLNGFVAPFDLSEGIKRTIFSEFIKQEKNKEIFFSE